MRIVAYLIIACTLAASELAAQEIRVSSSNQELVDIVEWAKKKALSFVVTGQKGPVDIWEKGQQSKQADYIPSYWAGYPLRTAFYSRDFCHQASGAHLLGLGEENFSMMKAFASSANLSRKWYPLWAINFDGSPYRLDYRGDDSFVREVPAVFELVEKAYQLYCWTGDKRYVEDATLWNYYTKAVTDFVALHDAQIPNGVAEGTGEGNIFKGTATFNEGRDVPFLEAGDGIACQYKAFWAYSKMAWIRGDKKLAKEFDRKAKALKKYFNTDWGIKGTRMYNRGYSANKESVDGWGKENSWFILMKDISEASSPRTAGYIEYVNQRLESKDDIPENIEALSYVPEVFFQYGRNEYGWRWMKHIMQTINETHAQSGLTGTNGNYPEVSYVLISNVVEGLAGLSAEAASNRFSTVSRLPGEVPDLSVDHIRVGKNLISVTHEGTRKSIAANLSGEEKLVWEALFPGTYSHVYVDGVKKKCKQIERLGAAYSVYELELKPGEKKCVTVDADMR